MTTRKESKRILSVSIQKIDDPDGDWSYLGEFSDDPKEYAIVHTGEHSGTFEDQLPCECGHDETDHNDAGYCMDNCDCEDFDRIAANSGDWRTLRFFNPEADDYKGEPDEEIRKYCLQDYERARTLVETWNFVGVRAEAEVQLTGDKTQTIRSGGLWGIESDSGDYFKEVETEQLAELREQLHAIGFSRRAIVAAFRDIQRSDA